MQWKVGNGTILFKKELTIYFWAQRATNGMADLIYEIFLLYLHILHININIKYDYSYWNGIVKYRYLV